MAGLFFLLVLGVGLIVTVRNKGLFMRYGILCAPATRDGFETADHCIVPSFL